MLGRKHEFKPDRPDSGVLNKLYLTKKQRRSILKWVLYTLVLVVLSLVQDVILCRVSIGGATTDLVMGAILLLCLLMDVETGAVFALVASTLFFFSGSAPGPYSILFITGIGVILSVFRHSYLREGFLSVMLTLLAGIMLYQVLIFFTALFLGRTIWSRFGILCLSGVWTAAVMPLLYPIFAAIGKIGGELWRE